MLPKDFLLDNAERSHDPLSQFYEVVFRLDLDDQFHTIRRILLFEERFDIVPELIATVLEQRFAVSPLESVDDMV